MKKTFGKIACLLILVILFTDLYPVAALGASSKIVSISNLSISVKLNQKYSLPKTVVATLNDKTVKNVSIIWNKNTLDSSKIGSYTFKGTVKGYTPKVILVVKVIGISDKPISSTKKEVSTTTPTEIPPTENLLDKWSCKRDLPSVNETKSSTTVSTGYSTITLIQSNNDVKKAVMCNNKIIYVHNDGKVKEYDPVLDSWSDKYEITQLRESNGDFQLLTVENLIYIIGVNFTDILVYNPTNNLCSLKTKLPTNRRVGGVVSAKNKIYILGGFDILKGCTIDTLDEYDPSTDKWTSKANMGEPANELAVTSLDDEIYILGHLDWDFKSSGVKYSQTLEVYNIKDNTWKVKASFPFGWRNEAMETVKDKIYILGQKQDSTNKDSSISIEEYNPKTNKTSLRAGTATERNKYASVVFDEEIYIIGGITYKQILEPQDAKDMPKDRTEYIKIIEKYTPPKP